MEFSIAGQTAIITGAANGIGFAIARRFAAEGANVLMADIDKASLLEALERIKNGKENVRIFVGDAFRKLTALNLLSMAIDSFGQVDILVNATRMIEMTKDPADSEEASFERLLDKNVMANMSLTRVIAQHMRQKSINSDSDSDGTEIKGAIINLSSIYATALRPELMGYCFAAGAVETMTKAMAVSLAQYKIRVNAIRIGSVLSGNMRAQLSKNTELKKHIKALTPLGRIAQTDEVAGAAQFLASPASSFITGHIMVVDGGRSLCDGVVMPSF